MTRRIRLLLVAVVVAALSTCLAGCMPSNPLEDTHTVTAYFPDSAGLFVGNDVGVLGVPIGKITEIEPAGIEVKVTMEIDADRAIPADAGAVVVARSVATDRYVELTPVYAGGPKLGDGAEIARDKTVTPVDFDDVLEALNTFATGIAGSKQGTKAIQDIINNGEAAFRGNGKLFNDTVKSLAEAVAGVSGQREDLSADPGLARRPGRPRSPRTKARPGPSSSRSPGPAGCSPTSG